MVKFLGVEEAAKGWWSTSGDSRGLWTGWEAALSLLPLLPPASLAQGPALPCPPCRASVHKAQKCTLCFSDSQLAESQETGVTTQRIGAFHSPVTLQLYLGIDPVQLLSLLLLPGPEQEKVVGWLCAALRSRVTKIHCSSPRWEHSRELAGAR